MPTILITGAASGLGYGFLQHYAQHAANTIIAVDRVLVYLHVTEHFPATVHTYVLDITKEEDVKQFVSGLKSNASTSHIDLVIHSAGVRGLVPGIETADDPGSVARAETLDIMTAETMIHAFKINCVGMFALFRALVPLLLPASSPSSDSKSANGTKPPQPPAKIIAMSSRMGSISYNTTGGGYAYRASKAALNAVIKSLSIDVPEVAWLALHPRRVETGLVQSMEVGAIGVDEAVRDCVGVIDRVKREDSGRFVDRFGKEIGW